jgi:cation transport ATPase
MWKIVRNTLWGPTGIFMPDALEQPFFTSDTIKVLVSMAVTFAMLWVLAKGLWWLMDNTTYWGWIVCGAIILAALLGERARDRAQRGPPK